MRGTKTKTIMCKSFDICLEQDYSTPPLVLPHAANQEKRKKDDAIAHPTCSTKVKKLHGAGNAIESPPNGDDNSGCNGFGQLKFDAVFLNDLFAITSGT